MKSARSVSSSRCLIVALWAMCGTAQASNWVTIGNPGNAEQSSANRDHAQSGGDGYGAVAYIYRINKYQVSIADWDLFYHDAGSGKQGTFNSAYNYWNDGTRTVGPDAPVTHVSFHQAAQYCNWLTTGRATNGAYTVNSSGHVTAIDRDFRNEDGRLYVLPTEDEWFKAAYYDGDNAKYTLYAHGADTVPPKSGEGGTILGETGWNYDHALSPSQPWMVDKGTAEQNGTFNMMGNVWDWMEDTNGVVRGGSYGFGENGLRSSHRNTTFFPTTENPYRGFRVVEIEPWAATVTLHNLNQVYDGTPREVTATTEPPGLTVEFTYDGNDWAPTNVGTYAVTGTVVSALYEGMATGTLTVLEAPSLVVTTTNDVVDALDGQTSLREAIAYAASLVGPQTITFSDTDAGGAVNFHDSSTHTITLGGSQLEITSDLTITGPGANALTISGNNASRVFFIASGNTVEISGLTISGGNDLEGGGIYNQGTLTLDNSAVSGNSADFCGGIYNEGTLMVLNSTVSGNSADDSVGGIYNASLGTLTVRNSTLSGNSADFAIGGIYNDGTLTLIHSTLSGNSAGTWADSIANDGAIDIGHTILHHGGSGGNYLGATPNSLGYNISSDGTGPSDGPGDVINTDPLLGPLADNGGPTLTHALLPYSPALSAGVPVMGITNDQRGVARPQGSAPDIGAFERELDDQTITDFLPPNGSVFAETDAVGLSATASSGLEVSFAVDSGPGTITDGTNLTFTGVGTVRIVASQAGDDVWNPAPDVTNTYTVVPLVVDFVGDPVHGAAPLTVPFTDLSIGDPTYWTWYFGDEDYSASWTQMTASAEWSIRHRHASAALSDGSLVVMGGHSLGSPNDVWRSTDQGATWIQVTASAEWAARSAHAAVALPDDSLVLMGGQIVGGDDTNDVWRSTDQGETWTQMTAEAGWAPRRFHVVAALPDGSLVLAGGYDGTDRFNDVWRSTDQGTTWTEMTASAEWAARDRHAMVVLPDESLVLMGGTTPRYNDVWRSTDQGATWTEMTANAEWSARYRHAAVAMPDGSILLMGGDDSGGERNDVWRSTDQGASWTQVAEHAEWSARRLHRAEVLPDGSVVVMGGHDGADRLNDVWRLATAGSNEQHPTHTYASPGSYTVTLLAGRADASGFERKEDYIFVGLPAIVTLHNLNQLYDGTPRVVTATTEPPGLTVEITYEGSLIPPTEKGSYEVIGVVIDPLYIGATTGTLYVGTAYYVNDEDQTDDVFTTAPGSAANDGLTPATPALSLQQILSMYTLGNADVVYVDTGYYLAASNALIDTAHSAANDSMVTIQGAGADRTVLDRGVTAAGTHAVHLANTTNIVLRDLRLERGSDALRIDRSRGIAVRDCEITGALRHGIYAYLSSLALSDSRLYDNSDYGLRGEACHAVELSGNRFEYNARGASVFAVNLLLENNIARWNSIFGISAIVRVSSGSLVATGNICEYNGGYGLWVDGMTASAGGTASGNRLTGNSGNGLVVRNHVTADRNVSENNGGAGIRIGTATAQRNEVSGNAVHGIVAEGDREVLRHNLVYANQGDQIRVGRGSNESIAGATVEHNNLLGLNGLALERPQRTRARNNIIWAQGSGGAAIRVETAPAGIFVSDYNNLHATDGAQVGEWTGVAQPDLAAWQAASGRDANSLSVDPLWVDAPADFHLRSTAGTYDGAPFTAPTGGVFVIWGEHSPCIDAGDPESPYDQESAYNGGRVNMGAFGNTPDASRSPLPPAPGGIPEEWLAGHGLCTAGSQNHLDLTGKGNTVEQDWIANTDPWDPESRFYIHVSVDAVEGGTRIYWPGCAGRLYTLEGRESLYGGNWFVIETFSCLADGIIEHIDPHGSQPPRQFYRVRVEVEAP